MTSPYLRALKMSDDYHFPTNRPDLPSVWFEVRLKDEAGNEIQTVRIPEESANAWVRHRQALLANCLGEDRPLFLPQSEIIPAPGQQVPVVEYWEPVPNTMRSLTLARKSVNLFERDRPHLRPSEASQLCARAYVRYLCRTYDAAKAELIRHHKDPIPPAVLSMDNIPAGAFDEGTSNFGELSR
jgi:hypothetical protein